MLWINIYTHVSLHIDQWFVSHELCLRYTGQVEMIVDVPESDAPYVIGAFVLDPVEGLAIAVETEMVNKMDSS